MPPSAMTPACSSARPTLVGRVMVTSMAPTVVAATIPAVDPRAQAIPAAKAHTASSGRNVTSRPAAR